MDHGYTPWAQYNYKGLGKRGQENQSEKDVTETEVITRQPL